MPKDRRPPDRRDWSPSGPGRAPVRPPPPPPRRAHPQPPATRRAPPARPGPSRFAPAKPAIRPAAPVTWECEAEIIPGLEGIAQDEITARFGGRVTFQAAPRPNTLRFQYQGDLRLLSDLRAAVAVYLVRAFPVPRPRGLLGNEHFEALLALIANVRRIYPEDAFRTLRLSAAGEDSTVLTRLKSDLAARTGLEPASEEGDLLLRLRRAAEGESWEALVRLAPRPLTARAWRVCNWPGALNAVVAYAMNTLAGAAPADRYLNLACGSGTLLIERLASGPARVAIGVDSSPEALACAQANLAAAGSAAAVRLLRADGGSLPLPSAAFDVITADLPFGQRVGTHWENERLYPRLLAEATRVAAPRAHFALITHEIRLIERLLAAPPLAAAWTLVDTRRITLPFGPGGLNPRIYLLERSPSNNHGDTRDGH